MKLLSGFYTEEEADEHKAFLERNGIATYLEYEGTRTSGFKYSLFIAIESQYEDAKQLMSNPNHQVINKVDLNEYHEYLASPEGKAAAIESMLAVAFKLTLTAIAFIVLIFFIGKAVFQA